MIYRILVTGANGYIGSKVIQKLTELGMQVVATDYSNSNIDLKVEFIKCDIFKVDNPMEFFKYPDICIHLAWRDGFVHNSLKHIEDLSNHYIFLNKLIDNKIKKLVIMGTMHEIGYYIGKIDNNTPTNPVSLYGIAKDTLRKVMFLRKIETEILWLRAFYIYGNDRSNPSIFGKLTQADFEGKKEFPINSGLNKYDFISINDLCEQIAYATIQNKFVGIINCCSGKAISLSDMLKKYISDNHLKIKLEYGKFPDRPYDSPEIYGDNSIITEILREYNK